MINFFKYHGTGNDFILIDDRNLVFSYSKELVQRLCHRNFGIGADGLILIRNVTGFDFEMVYYNSDGLPGSMCGNGGRCAVAFAHHLKLIENKAIFTAFDGGHKADLLSVDPYLIKLHMKDVRNIELGANYAFLDTGSPHYCLFVDRVKGLDVVNEGKKIRYNDRFSKNGTNVNFIEIDKEGIAVRTYERGVENETLSCGTGVTASALAAVASGRFYGNNCKVSTPGGILKVSFIKDDKGFSAVWLEGPAEKVFEGVF